jgi:hypothetical protein
MPPVGISELIREGSLSDIASDIPPGVTLAEYGTGRSRKSGGRLKLRVASILSPRWLK